MRVYNKNKKAFLIFSCLFLLLFIQFGYSYLNSVLNINGNIDITKNTWDVHFENIVLTEGSVEATTPATIVDDTTINFAATFQNQGESYEFEVDIVNSGGIDASLSEIIKTDLVALGIEYLDYSVTYVNGTELNVKDVLYSSSKETLKIVIKYRDDITSDQIPQDEKNITISLKLLYVQDDGSGRILYNFLGKQSVLDNVSSEYVTEETGINLQAISSDTNGKGLYTLASTIGNDYPIYYYRGDVENNNLVFAGFCWKIVRTTDTGGVKLLYNGVPNDDGSCTATGDAAQISASKFASNAKYLSSAGYMYGSTEYYSNNYKMNVAGFLNKTVVTLNDIGSTNYMYSDSVSYDTITGNYTLINPENRVWSTTHSDNKFKYTCLSETESSCSSVNYILSSSSSTVTYYTTFSSGTTAEATQNMQIVYGNDISYDETTGMYTLLTTMASAVKNWETDFNSIIGANGYRYTCFSESNTCSEVKFIYSYRDYASDYNSHTTGDYGVVYYMNLKNGKLISNIFSDTFSEDNDKRNKTNSFIKTTIDSWYLSNINDYTNMLEDTIWCNDRSISDYGGFDISNSAAPQSLYYSAHDRLYDTGPSFVCSEKLDAFTVNDIVNGNGKLTYPVGLLTADELVYAGQKTSTNNKNTYLYTGNDFWTMTPYNYASTSTLSVSLTSSGGFYFLLASVSRGVRPAVSLNYGIKFAEGDGTSTSPYVVKKQ